MKAIRPKQPARNRYSVIKQAVGGERSEPFFGRSPPLPADRAIRELWQQRTDASPASEAVGSRGVSNWQLEMSNTSPTTLVVKAAALSTPKFGSGVTHGPAGGIAGLLSRANQQKYNSAGEL